MRKTFQVTTFHQYDFRVLSRINEKCLYSKHAIIIRVFFGYNLMNEFMLSV